MDLFSGDLRVYVLCDGRYRLCDYRFYGQFIWLVSAMAELQTLSYLTALLDLLYDLISWKIQCSRPAY